MPKVGIGGKGRRSTAKAPSALGQFLAKYRDQRGFLSNVELAKALDVAPSAISMIIAGRRRPSPKLGLRLAEILCPEGQSLSDFTNELFRLAGLQERESPLFESVTSRIARKKAIRAAFILNPPFVFEKSGEYSGFAVELFRQIVSMLGAQYELKVRELKDMYDDVSSGDADIFVAGLIPTFHRKQFMSFSRPFPFLRLSLSALVLKDVSQRISVQTILGHSAEKLQGIKVLLVRSEVGEEFTRAFLPSIELSNEAQVVSESSLKTEALLERFKATKPPHVLLADMATCQTLMAHREGSKLLEPLRDNDPVGQHLRPKDSLPVLARFPMAFGIRKGDSEWGRTLDEAFGALMSEGIRALLSLYQKYLADPRLKFRNFLMTRNQQGGETEEILPDETIETNETRELFRTFLSQYVGKTQRSRETKSR